MSKFTCLILYTVAASLSNVLADDEGPASMQDITDILLECANLHGVTIDELQAVAGAEDVKKINSCVWSCTLRKAGFLDDKGHYVLNPGLTYVKRIVHYNDEAYANLENIAKQCESVKDKKVSDGEAGCEMGALVVACFLESLEQARQSRISSKD